MESREKFVADIIRKYQDLVDDGTLTLEQIVKVAIETYEVDKLIYDARLKSDYKKFNSKRK